MPNKLAFDRASVRSVDVNGRMHIELTNISMAAVNPYLGEEIPGYQALGLAADTVYQLLRDPAELAKAAPTFDNLPLLSKHVPVFADKPEKSLVVGSTGTDAEFVAPYLKNSMVVWDSAAIRAIESGQQRELSCAYFYRPDMTPGVHEGIPYDGVMRDIKANHVALVETGRAGPDVLVSDANPFKPLEQIHMKNPQRVARQSAALAVALSPLLAMDTSIKPDEFVKNLALALDAAEPDGDEPPSEKPAEKPTEDEQGPDESDEDYKARVAKKKVAEDKDDEVEDEDEADKKPGEKKAAMDAAIRRAGAAARAAAVKDFQDIRRAEKEIFPHVGEVAAMDSATAYYKLALDAAKVDLTGVDKSAYGALVRMLPKPGEAKSAPRMAQDSAAVSSFHERFPTAAKPARSY